MSLLKKFLSQSEEQDLHEADEDVDVEELLEERASPEAHEPGQLAVDVYQNKDQIIIQSTIGGVKPEDLDISIANDMVTIKGKRNRVEEVKAEDYFFQECYWGSFSRSLALPVEIDVDKARADLKDGVLTIVLPKASRARTKKIKVREGEENNR